MTFVFWISFLMLIYVFFIYPALILIMGRKNKRAEKDMTILPKVTLLISAYNEEKVIAEKIKNSLALDYPHDLFEIIVVSDGSTDRTNKIVSGIEDPRLRFFSYPDRGGKVKALNTGFEYITGDIIVLTDANVIFQSDAIRKLIAKFADESIGCVVGNVILMTAEGNATAESIYSRYEKAIHTAEGNWKTMITVDGAMYGIRREFITAMPPDTITDDWYLATAALIKNRRIIYEPDAIGYEQAAKSISGEFTRKIRMVAGGYQTAFRRAAVFFNPFHHPKVSFMFTSHKLLRWMASIFLALAYISSLILAFSNDPLYLILVLCQSLFYMIALLGYLFRSVLKSDFFNIPYYFMAANWASLLGLVQFLLRRQKVTWKPGRH